MNIPKFFLRNWQFTVCVFLLLGYWGWQSFQQMPKSEDPLFPLPQFTVVALYPGAGPTDLERLVVTPIEAAVNELGDIETVRTNINDGVATLNVKFTQNADEDQKYNDLLRTLDKLRPALPEALTSLDVVQASTSNVNILQFAIVGSAGTGTAELRRAAEQLQAAAQAVKGVRTVAIQALPAEQVRVAVDLPRMAALGLSLSNVLQAVQNESANTPGGFLDVGRNRYTITTGGGYADLDAVRNTIIKSAGGNLVYLSQVADVQMGYGAPTYYGRYQGQPALFLTVNQQEGTNIFDIAGPVSDRLDALKTNLPTGVQVVKMFDQSLSVRERLHHLYRDFGIAVVLVLLTLLPLGWRAAVVVLFAIPSSLFAGLILLDASGQSLNQFSIVGLIIALGLLVDDSIIVVENIVANIRRGVPREQAAIDGTNQLLKAIMGVTACLLLSFAPLLLLGGATGDFIRSLPLAVIFALLGSLFVSLTLTPFIASRLLTDSIGDNVFYRALHWLNEGPFLRVLHLCMRFPKSTLAVALGLVLGGGALLPVVGFSFFPTAEKPQFLVNITLPLESNLARVDSVTQQVEALLRRTPQVKDFATNLGKGNPQVYYNLPQQPQKGNTAQIFCQLRDYEKEAFNQTLDTLRAQVARIPGADVQVKVLMQGPPVQNPIEIRLAGDDLTTLTRLAAEVEALMRSTPGTLYVNNPVRETKSEIRLRINQDRARQLGVSKADIDRTVRMAFAGLTAGTYTDAHGDQFDVVVALPDSGTRAHSLQRFDALSVASQTGQMIPLSQFATPELAPAAAAIQHYNNVRTVTVTSSVATGYNTNEVTQQVLKQVRTIRLPSGYSATAGGELEKRKESFGGLTTVLIVALLGIVAVLILEFGSVRGTVIVASAIPLGVFGSVVALWLGGYPFSFTAFIGLVTLVGLEVKNTIIIVDFTNQLRAAGYSIDEAIEKAREERFTPIFLTTLTAIGGLVPLVLERSDFFSPLALVLIGGLLSSLLLTRFVEPVLYKLLMK